jgi:hypothetical protein
VQLINKWLEEDVCVILDMLSVMVPALNVQPTLSPAQIKLSVFAPLAKFSILTHLLAHNVLSIHQPAMTILAAFVSKDTIT